MPGNVESLLHVAPCGIFSIAEDGCIILANDYCSKLLEYHPGELTGKNISELLTLAGKIFYQTHFYPLVKLHQHAEEIFLNLQTKLKKDVPVVLNAVVTKTGTCLAIVCSFVQVPNRRKYEDEILMASKQAEEALRRNKALEEVKHALEIQQKELDKQVTLLKFQNNELLQLSNVISHDLQEPIRKLIFYSHELIEGNLQNDRKVQALSVIKRSSIRLKSLVLNLQEYLGLSALDSDKKPIDLTGVIQDELGKLHKSHPSIQVKAEITPLPLIVGDKNQLQFMFYHLLKNAFEHGTTGNSLDLCIKAVVIKENLFSSRYDKYTYVDYVKITIADKGPGFENIYNEYIFDFVKKLKSGVDSVGFGLSFCKKIVENHFGKITADSGVGAGSTFTVMLPVDYVSWP